MIMKKNLLLLSLLALVLFSCGPKETTDTAITYNDEMIAIQTKVDNSLVDLLDAIDTFDEATMLDAKKESLKVIEDAEKQINAKADFDKKDDYKKEMLKLIGMYKTIINEDLSDLIDMTLIYDQLTEEETDNYYTLYDTALEKYEKAFDEFNAFQKKFSEEWKFTVTKEEETK